MIYSVLSMIPTALLVLCISNSCDGINLCHIECPECNNDCRHGTYIDLCGREVCARGPGQQCGGIFNIGGKCGDGLSCGKCERCTGCSLRTGVCTDDEYSIC